jgi:hypothetical protein
MFLPVIAPFIALGTAILCLLAPTAAAIVIPIFLSLIRRPSGPAEVPIYEISVDDASSGRVVNVEMIGRRGGGSIEVGDEVEVYGRWVHSTVRASKIHITLRYSPSLRRRVPCGAIIKAKRQFPPAVAIGTFIVTLMPILWTCIAALSSGY